MVPTVITLNQTLYQHCSLHFFSRCLSMILACTGNRSGYLPPCCTVCTVSHTRRVARSMGFRQGSLKSCVDLSAVQQLRIDTLN